eukprot:Seg1121.21 transcript_id=Seg1121.21/GoldUCD/mRNA.D3Y31 product="hypothetical protein" protein_id=Seg1121.21/GoldUCD/D3Y31
MADSSDGRKTTPSKTPVMCVEVLSPSAFNICIICAVDIALNYKNPVEVRVKVFGEKKGELLKKELLEEYLGIELKEATDLPYICKNCYRSICTASKATAKNRTKFIKLRAEVREKYMRTKTKRCRSAFANKEKEDVQEQKSGLTDRPILQPKKQPRRSLFFNPTATVADDVELTDDNEGIWK